MFQAEGTACAKASVVGKIMGLREGGSGGSQGVTAGAGQRGGQGWTPQAWARPGPPSLPVDSHDCLSKDSL